MPLDPQAQEFLDMLAATRFPGFESMPIPVARALFLARDLGGPPVPVDLVEDRVLPGDIPARVYTPRGPGPKPALLYFHGGGWVLGGLDTVDAPCRRLADAADCIVVSVDYRLAPSTSSRSPPRTATPRPGTWPRTPPPSAPTATGSPSAATAPGATWRRPSP